jgi:hypothetical protein
MPKPRGRRGARHVAPSAIPGDPAVLHDIPRSGERLSGLSRQTCYAYLRVGLLKAVKVGDRTLITDQSLRGLPERLPPYCPDSAERSERMAELKRGAKVPA